MNFLLFMFPFFLGVYACVYMCLPYMDLQSCEEKNIGVFHASVFLFPVFDLGRMVCVLIVII